MMKIVSNNVPTTVPMKTATLTEPSLLSLRLPSLDNTTVATGDTAMHNLHASICCPMQYHKTFSYLMQDTDKCESDLEFKF